MSLTPLDSEVLVAVCTLHGSNGVKVRGIVPKAHIQEFVDKLVKYGIEKTQILVLESLQGLPKNECE